jgi:predicted alpha/beta superfamily hydrolase
MKAKEPIVGTLERYQNFASEFVPARTTDVWLPPEVDASSRLPVIYMQDGQNLFDPRIAYGGVDWGIDEAIARLTKAGRISPVIVVGVWNVDQRWREYMPAKALEMVEKPEVRSRFLREQGGMPISDRYLRFLVEEVKALVDQEYPTRTGRADTYIMGSSMGGLLSLYALCECPHVFGGAGCLSTVTDTYRPIVTGETG